MLPLNRLRPALPDFLFSVKTFSAAMLALLVALCFDLQNPYWAVTTVYVVSSPLSGTSTSKALYRLLGTAIGGVMTVILVPNLVNSPILLTAAVSLWIGLCLAISLLDRTPRSYVFMLAGYTTALTAFPIVATPDEAFTTAAARTLEIAVGILSAALVNRIVFPRHVGPVLATRIDTWLGDASEIIVAMLGGEHSEPAFKSSIHRLAAEAVDIRGFTIHAAYDTSGHRDVVDLAKRLQTRMVVVLPMISALSDTWLAVCKTWVDPSHAALTKGLAEDITSWLRSGLPLSEDIGRRLDDRMQAIRKAATQLSLEERRLVDYATTRTNDLIQIWNDCLILRDDIVSGSRHQLGWRRFGLGTKDWAMHRDYGIALHSGLSTILATVITTVFWIASGWSEGGIAAMMAAVLCCIFSTMDDPTPAMRGFLVFSTLSVMAAFVLEFGVLPAIDGYIPLVAALGLFLIPSGCLMARPQTAISGLAFSMMLPTLLSLKDRLALDFETFTNGNLAILFGFAVAWGTTAMVRSMSAEVAARRLIRAGWRDIASSVARVNDPDLSHRMIDRVGLLAPRIAALPAHSELLQIDILHDLRDAFNISELMRCRHDLPKANRAVVGEVLKLVGQYYQARLRSTHATSLPDLAAAIDRAEAQLSNGAIATLSAESCRVAFAGLRYSLVGDDRSEDGGHRPAMLNEDTVEQAA